MTTRILNMTLQPMTDELRALGVVPIDPVFEILLQDALTWAELPDPMTYHYRTDVLVVLAHAYRTVMIDPPPFYAPTLERALRKSGCRVVYPYRWTTEEEREIVVLVDAAEEDRA